MATAARSRYAQTPKARNDAYTGLLFISFLALVASCVFLYLDYDQYGKSSPQFTPSVKSPPGTLPAATQPETPSTPTSPMGGGASPMGGAPTTPMGGTPMTPAPGGGPGPPVPGGAPAGGAPKSTLSSPKQDTPATVAPTSDVLELPPLSPSKSHKSAQPGRVNSVPN